MGAMGGSDSVVTQWPGARCCERDEEKGMKIECTKEYRNVLRALLRTYRATRDARNLAKRVDDISSHRLNSTPVSLDSKVGNFAI